MKPHFLLITLPLLLCLVPLVITAASWQIERHAQSPLPGLRMGLFRVGLLLSVLGLFLTASCWLDPYPLTATADGGFSIAWLGRAWIGAFVMLVVSTILALFGKGWPRIMLVLSGVLSLLLEYGSLLQNGV